jgi:hypothetical protein
MSSSPSDRCGLDGKEITMSRSNSTRRSSAFILTLAICVGGLVGVGSSAHAQADRTTIATDLSGTWDSNVGLVYEISRTSDGFMWRVTDSPQLGRITVEGQRLNASWGPQDGPTKGSATGTVTDHVDGKPSRIQWSNRVVFTRRAGVQPQLQIDPKVATRVDPLGKVHVDPTQLTPMTPPGGAAPSNQLRQRAAQLVEDLRSVMPGGAWKDAAVSPAFRPLYRPDLDQVAYFEFEVRNYGGSKTGSPAGFVVLSTSLHDYPVAHWSSDGRPPTYLLDERAAQKGRQTHRYYKLTDLSYAAEDQGGELVAHLGDQPVRLSGMQQQWIYDPSPPIVTVTAEPVAGRDQDDSQVQPDAEYRVERTGPAPTVMFDIGGWSSWQQLKSGYAAAFKVPLEARRYAAAEDWEAEDLIAESGEGMAPGSSRRIAVLDKGATVGVTGPGAGQVQLSDLVAAGGMARVAEVRVANTAASSLPFEIEVKSLTGTTKVVKFFIVLPIPEVFTIPTTYWRFEFAGGAADQCHYWQFDVDLAWYEVLSWFSDCDDTCLSGCGPTAWGMLFGWADRQAEANKPYWAARKGIYRKDGGKGANATAPKSMDKGVQNMIIEIRDQVNTFCADCAGATAPWSMENVVDYLKGRTGTKLVTHYNLAGVTEDRLMKHARDSIAKRNTPAVIGTGWLTHYPLAYGYSVKQSVTKDCASCKLKTVEHAHAFQVNQGWQKKLYLDWVPADTWFAGEIFP